MFLSIFIFVVSYLKIQPAGHLNTSKALTSFQSERKVKKDKMVSWRAPERTNRTEKNSNIITLVTAIIITLS